MHTYICLYNDAFKSSNSLGQINYNISGYYIVVICSENENYYMWSAIIKMSRLTFLSNKLRTFEEVVDYINNKCGLRNENKIFPSLIPSKIICKEIKLE